MADSLTHSMQGMDAILAKLKALEQVPRQKATQFALRKAANLVRDNAKARAERLDDPETDSNIAANVVTRLDTRHKRNTGELKFSVGVRGGAKHGKTYHWRFLEFGTSKMAAQPFMRPAMDESIAPATDEFVKHFDKAIDRAIKRANKART